ncbi:TonB-dependent receptor [Edaphobacter aggregans]|uniref:TonB-dependent receptor n=1 Tax=Edaphobacter aggregans TaxID=570835 RepID=UPI00054D98CF|nr:TonB-dependent receptor [Edaphobacter aggregans]
MKIFLRLSVIVYIIFGLALGSPAQTSSGQISGRVVDSTGAAIPGAVVTLTNQATGEVRGDRTEGSGEFVFVAVQPGTFTVSVSMSNFKKYEKRNLTLHASERLAAGNIQLEIGAVTESVDVQADQTPIQTESSERSAVVDSKELTTLMTQSRDVTSMLRLLPGVVKDPSTGQLGQQNAGNINGVRSDYNSLSIDGTTGNTRGGAILDTGANYDSIGEVKVLLNNYQAEYGQAAGSIVELVTKSGTRNFHGSVYYYNRNEAYNANDYFNKNKTLVDRPRTRYNTVGYNIGGPAYIPHVFNTNKDKMFFFWSQEHWPTTKPGALLYWMMPTALEKQGNFSASVDKSGKPITFLKDPTKVSPTVPCAKAGDPGCFPSLVIPPSRINPDTQKLLAILPTGNPTYLGDANGGKYNYVTQGSVKTPVNQQVLRVDYNISQKLHAYFRGMRTTTEQNGANVASVNAAMQWGVPFVYSTPGKNASLNLTFIPSPNLINELNIGFASWNETSRFSNDGDLAKFQRDKLGMNMGQYNPTYNPLNLVPRASWGGSAGFQVVNSPQILFDNRFPLSNDTRSWQVQDSITKVWNRHTSKAGFYFQKGNYLQRHIGSTFDGQFSFDTNNSNPVDTGYAYANGILGTYNSYTEGSNTVDYNPQWYVVEWYLQDSWKVVPRFTLDYGLRFTYDIPTVLNKGQGAGFVQSRYDPSKVPQLYQPIAGPKGRAAIINPAIAGPPGSATNPYLPAVYIGQFVPNSGNYSNGVVVNTDPNYPWSLRESNGLLVAPRVGFAWDMRGDGKTAIRGGAGLFYNTREGGGTVGDYSLIAPLVYNPVQNYGDARQFSNNCSGSACSSGTTLISPQATRILQFNRPIETMFNTMLGVQQAVGFQTVVDVSYVGTFGRHLNEQLDLNTVPYLSQFNPANVDPSQNTTFTPILGHKAADCPAKVASAALLYCQPVPLSDNFFRPTPGFSNVNLRSYSGTSAYHSLQMQITRRFAKGLQFGVVYTWSKVMTDNDSVNGAVGVYQPHRWWNWGLASFDRTNNFVAHWSWDLPRGSSHFSNFATRFLLDNWQYSGIAEFISGAPQTITLNTGGVNLTGGGDGARAIVNVDPKLAKGDRTVTRYFNASAFVMPTPRQIPTEDTPGITRSTVFRGPGTNNFDMAVNKNFPVHEGMMFQIRAEAYNVFNHASFNKVDTTVRFDATTVAGGAQTSPTFGNLTGDRGPRTMQLSGRFNF